MLLRFILVCIFSSLLYNEKIRGRPHSIPRFHPNFFKKLRTSFNKKQSKKIYILDIICRRCLRVLLILLFFWLFFCCLLLVLVNFLAVNPFVKNKDLLCEKFFEEIGFLFYNQKKKQKINIIITGRDFLILLAQVD